MFKDKHKTARRVFAVIIFSLGLTACGGGGGGGGPGPKPPPPPPPPPVAPSKPTLAVSIVDIKTLQFNWTGGVEADFFKLMVNPDGASGFTQDGANLLSLAAASPSTTREIPVHLIDWARATYQLEACNTVGCTASDAVDLTALVIEQAIGYFKASNSEIGDSFGDAVAMNAAGDTVAISALNEDSGATGINGDQNDGSVANSGAVYVFAKNSAGVWAQQAYIKSPAPDVGDDFGNDLALSSDGNTLAVGVPSEDNNESGIGGDPTLNNVAGNDSGAVFIFVRDVAGLWSQQAYLKASTNGGNDNFGDKVALGDNGNTLAVSATGEDSNAIGIDGDETNNTLGGSGAVYVFTRSGTAWAQQAYIKASNTDTGDTFGSSVALAAGDGNTLAVGAVGEDSAAVGIDDNQIDDCGVPGPTNCEVDSGAVYVFTRSGTAWLQQAYVKASNTGLLDDFGRTVALSGDGNTLTVGAPQEGSDATGINGNQTNNGADNSGAVYLYNRSGTTWLQEAYIKASNTENFDDFGRAIALSDDGNLLAVGASREQSSATGINSNQSLNDSDDAGAVFVFKRDTSNNWMQQSYVKASNTGTDDKFGGDIGLSGNGNILVVGADLEDSAATGINGDQSDDTTDDAGAAYIY